MQTLSRRYQRAGWNRKWLPWPSVGYRTWPVDEVTLPPVSFRNVPFLCGKTERPFSSVHFFSPSKFFLVQLPQVCATSRNLVQVAQFFAAELHFGSSCVSDKGERRSGRDPLQGFSAVRPSGPLETLSEIEVWRRQVTRQVRGMHPSGRGRGRVCKLCHADHPRLG